MSRSADTQVQELIHQLEMGPLKTVVLRAAFVAVVAALAALYLFYSFHGLDSETAMDQAQIGRQIAAGAGYSTLYIRPLAIWQLQSMREDQGGALSSGFFPDTYNFPLNPALNAALLRPVKRWWPMGPTDMVYKMDRLLAAAGIVMFLVSVTLTFFLVRELFDPKIAWLTAGLVLLTDMMWRFSVSGLPQNVMLLLFTAALLFVHRALNAREEEKTGRMLLHLAATALLLGLATLAQPVATWIFLGFLAFTALWFRPRGVSAPLVFFIWLLVVAPWLVRNYLICGNPFGLGIFAILDGTSGSESSFMRNLNPDMLAFGSIRGKLRSGFTGQFENLFSYLGFNAAAATFFFALLHVFKRHATNMLRWAVALMWLGAATGMAQFPPQGAVSANQLHMLFVPVFAAYGMAFLLVLWNRLDLRLNVAKKGFLGMVCVVTALPMAVNLLTTPPMSFAWPPYIPPIINTVSRWMKPGEIICSDMPWATAWYGGVPSLLLPSDIQQFLGISDYKTLGGPVNGLYLTPVSGNKPFLSQIARGEYAAWGNFILRRPDLTPNFSSFPLQQFVPLPINGESIFFSDSPRWQNRE